MPWNSAALISIRLAGKGSAGSVWEVRIETSYGNGNVNCRVWISWMRRKGTKLCGK